MGSYRIESERSCHHNNDNNDQKSINNRYFLNQSFLTCQPRLKIEWQTLTLGSPKPLNLQCNYEFWVAKLFIITLFCEPPTNNVENQCYKPVLSNHILPLATLTTNVATKTLLSPLLSKFKRNVVYLPLEIYFSSTLSPHVSNGDKVGQHCSKHSCTLQIIQKG